MNSMNSLTETRKALALSFAQEVAGYPHAGWHDAARGTVLIRGEGEYEVLPGYSRDWTAVTAAIEARGWRWEKNHRIFTVRKDVTYRGAQFYVFNGDHYIVESVSPGTSHLDVLMSAAVRLARGEGEDSVEPVEPAIIRAKYWSTKEDDECLSDESLDDAVDYYVNQFAPEEKLPAEVVVYGFAQTKPKLSGVLEQALEWLDEEYANPEGESTQPTDAMREAERVFIAAVLKDYDCWACEVVDKVTVDLKKWCADNDREWP